MNFNLRFVIHKKRTIIDKERIKGILEEKSRETSSTPDRSINVCITDDSHVAKFDVKESGNITILILNSSERIGDGIIGAYAEDLEEALTKALSQIHVVVSEPEVFIRS